MERLTVKGPSGLISLKNKSENGANQAIKCLSEYEDTGLTPQEIIELKERDTAKNPDIIGVDKDEFRIGRCPKCGVMPRSYMRFCPNCGQRLKWEGRHEDIRR